MPLISAPTMTESAVEARRRNARRSTGPRSPAGKARSRLNALQHGGYASPGAWSDASLRALGEDPGSFHDLVWRFKNSDGPPADPLWEFTAEHLARQVWRRQRLDRAWETLAGQSAAHGEPGELVVLTPEGMTLLAQMDAADRALDRNMRALMRLREAEARHRREVERRTRRRLRQELETGSESSEERLVQMATQNALREEELARLCRFNPVRSAPVDRDSTAPPPALQPASPHGSADQGAAPADKPAESAHAAAVPKPATAACRNNTKSPERSEDVVEKTGSRIQDSAVRHEQTAPKHS